MFNMFGGMSRRMGGTAMAPSLMGGLSRGPMNQQMPGRGGSFRTPIAPQPRSPMFGNKMQRAIGGGQGFQQPQVLPPGNPSGPQMGLDGQPMLGGPSMEMFRKMLMGGGGNRMLPHMGGNNSDILASHRSLNPSNRLMDGMGTY